jgi:hypothetical protein
MTFLIDSKKGFNWNITIGRKMSWCSQLDLISITKEWREKKEVIDAVYVKGFFREK